MESNPYLEARREWDERYADHVLGKCNWQIAAGGLLLLSLILASSIAWFNNRSRDIPYVVEVDKLGFALAVPQALRRRGRHRARGLNNHCTFTSGPP
jgi:type IV secretion system protein TrbF